MTIIVFEGADGAGKSTLAKRLAAKYQAQYYHSGGPKSKQDMHRILLDLEDMAESSKLYLVDRHPAISEFVYSRVFDKDLIVPIPTLTDAWKYMTLVVHCVAPKDQYVISKEFKEHKSDSHTKFVEANADRIKAMYNALMGTKDNFPKLTVNTRDEASIRTLERFIEGLN